jgi:hypothetical protein
MLVRYCPNGSRVDTEPPNDWRHELRPAMANPFRLTFPRPTFPDKRRRIPFPDRRRRNPVLDLTERTIVLLRRASDFAAVVHDKFATEVEIDGAKVFAASLEVQLRVHAGKLEWNSRKQAADSPSYVLSPSVPGPSCDIVGEATSERRTVGSGLDRPHFLSIP